MVLLKQYTCTPQFQTKYQDESKVRMWWQNLVLIKTNWKITKLKSTFYMFKEEHDYYTNVYNGTYNFVTLFSVMVYEHIESKLLLKSRQMHSKENA